MVVDPCRSAEAEGFRQLGEKRAQLLLRKQEPGNLNPTQESREHSLFIMWSLLQTYSDVSC